MVDLFADDPDEDDDDVGDGLFAPAQKPKPVTEVKKKVNPLFCQKISSIKKNLVKKIHSGRKKMIFVKNYLLSGEFVRKVEFFVKKNSVRLNISHFCQNFGVGEIQLFFSGFYW